MAGLKVTIELSELNYILDTVREAKDAVHSANAEIAELKQTNDRLYLNVESRETEIKRLWVVEKEHEELKAACIEYRASVEELVVAGCGIRDALIATDAELKKAEGRIAQLEIDREVLIDIIRITGKGAK